MSPSMAHATPQRAALAARRQRRALHLFVLGATYAEVAASLLACQDHLPHGRPGCPECLPMYADRSGAKKAVERALLEDHSMAAADRESGRRIMLAQIRAVISRAMAKALEDSEGDLEAMRTLVRLWDRQSKLMGLDAPTRVTVTPELDLELEAAVALLMEEAQAATRDAAG